MSYHCTNSFCLTKACNTHLHQLQLRIVQTDKKKSTIASWHLIDGPTDP